MSYSDLQRLRDDITQSKHAEEHAFVERLLEAPALDESQGQSAKLKAAGLVELCRQDIKSQTLLDSFLQEYGLSNQEGVALMCLAEALLRVPDGLTADRLIAEKLGDSNWVDHAGKSTAWLVNAATWGLVLTGKIVHLDPQITQQPSQFVDRLVHRLSAPVVRIAVLQAMKLMGGQYVLGRSIHEGIKRGHKLNRNPDVRFSFDMLGEGARTLQDAERYFKAYSDAFDHVGQLNDSDSVIGAHGVSVKLSALHPQYHVAHHQTVMEELLPKITALCVKAKQYNIGLSIDAEEAARLEMSLDIFQALCENPKLADWRGLGFVMQAYQKRAPAVANWLVALARKTSRSIMVRLVKGAYWDAEIKHAQELGLADYPVFTRKVNTDVCYLHCAKTLLQGTDHVFPQFATHNAHTVVAISELASTLGVDHYEFQRLHGMGELLYKHVPTVQNGKSSPLRIYAPIGEHRDLLPYLVRRLLENGANSSFVNQFLDAAVPADHLVEDCYKNAGRYKQLRHSQIPIPKEIFWSNTSKRINARGFDLDSKQTVNQLTQAIQRIRSKDLAGHSIVDGKAITQGKPESSLDPSTTDTPCGSFHTLSAQDLDQAIEVAYQAEAGWQSQPNGHRAKILQSMAESLESNSEELIGLISREAGRTIPDCVSEVREAVDFCRYYAEQIGHHPERPAVGTFLCISPWNFPLAIFTGQIAAALVTGNCVLAKPADPTPIVATRATQLFHEAGVPTNVLQLLIGDGPTIGGALLPDARLSGVAFTGSTLVAKTIASQLAERNGPAIPFIAETGGQNCMVVDSTALPEQVVDDVIASAFHSAGQRCSALRVLYVQDVIADSVVHMLEGAMSNLRVGNPSTISTDVGPIIDNRARSKLLEHAERMDSIAIKSLNTPISEEIKSGCFFAPRVYEIDSIRQLEGEVFGPILHLVRYKMSELESVINDINSTGYGLTFGVHSRISAFADYLFNRTTAGNVYINRNTVGAMVGVNPFGGRDLSGTGPKAGGPNYLLRFQQTTELGSELKVEDAIEILERRESEIMPGPTGESNELSHTPIGNVLFVLNEQTPLKELIHITNITLALGNTATFTVRNIANKAQHDALLSSVPERFHSRLKFNEENVLARVSNQAHQAVVIHGSHPELNEYKRRVVKRQGSIVPVIQFDKTVMVSENLSWYASYLSAERTKTDNLVAKGGNTQLFNLHED